MPIKPIAEIRFTRELELLKKELADARAEVVKLRAALLERENLLAVEQDNSSRIQGILADIRKSITWAIGEG